MDNDTIKHLPKPGIMKSSAFVQIIFIDVFNLKIHENTIDI